jgi:hypothetical protein
MGARGSSFRYDRDSSQQGALFGGPRLSGGQAVAQPCTTKHLGKLRKFLKFLTNRTFFFKIRGTGVDKNETHEGKGLALASFAVGNHFVKIQLIQQDKLGNHYYDLHLPICETEVF